MEPITRPMPNIASFTMSGLLMACVTARRTRTSVNGLRELFIAMMTSFVVSPMVTRRALAPR